MEGKPLILITNDDSHTAKGIKKLVSLMMQIGDVVVISTEKVMSAQGHSITVREPLRVKLVKQREGYKEYLCNGTPVDCVKLGYQKLMDRYPDLVVSGINHGSNASANVVYSGTMAAVVEACMDGITAVGYSLDCYDADADFDHLDDYILAITRKVLREGLPKGVCLNVNFPKRCEEPIKGLRICRQAKAKWVESLIEHHDADGEPYYDLTGVFVYEDEGDDTDVWALEHNYVSLVPTGFDWTVKEQMGPMRKFETVLFEK